MEAALQALALLTQDVDSYGGALGTITAANPCVQKASSHSSLHTSMLSTQLCSCQARLSKSFTMMSPQGGWPLLKWLSMRSMPAAKLQCADHVLGDRGQLSGCQGQLGGGWLVVLCAPLSAQLVLLPACAACRCGKHDSSNCRHVGPTVAGNCCCCDGPPGNLQDGD